MPSVQLLSLCLALFTKKQMYKVQWQLYLHYLHPKDIIIDGLYFRNQKVKTLLGFQLAKDVINIAECFPPDFVCIQIDLTTRDPDLFSPIQSMEFLGHIFIQKCQKEGHLYLK